MFTECVLLSHLETMSGSEMMSVKKRNNYQSLIDVEYTTEFQQLQTIRNYIDDPVVFGNNTKTTIFQLKNQISKLSSEVVIVSPQTAALETCFELFGDKEGVDIYVEPLLQPRINSTYSLPKDT